MPYFFYINKLKDKFLRTLNRLLLYLIIVYLTNFMLWSIFKFSPLDIESKLIKTIIFEYIFLWEFPFFLFALILKLFLNKRLKLYIKIIIAITILGSSFYGVSKLSWSLIWHSHSVWNDGDILAKHETNKRKIVVKQLIDSGALGYDKRVVKKYQLSSWLSWNKEIYDPEKLNDHWIIIDRHFGF